MAAIPFPSDALSVTLVIVFAALAAYRIPYFKKRHFMRISLLQILYLVVVPGIIFVIAISYIQKLTSLPIAPNAIFPDRLLTTATFLSMFYAYAGLAIHATTKTLMYKGLRFQNSEAGQLNRYFHLQFSHNLIFITAVTIPTFITLIELNHTPIYSYEHWSSPIIRGLILGFAFLISLYTYTRSEMNDDYTGRWADLKAVFACSWVALVIILSTVIYTDAPLKAYQFLLPSLFGFACINTVFFFLAIRRLRRSKKDRLMFLLKYVARYLP